MVARLTREEQNESHDDAGHDTLDDCGQTPCPGRTREVLVGAVCSPAGNNVSNPPDYRHISIHIYDGELSKRKLTVVKTAQAEFNDAQDLSYVS